ncbi:unnamed protein product [Adineta ricciae]|uniref:N-acetyltransferase domain-containing protein n=1 Tax=Adineta ricciae TaxID=249248 RepID=A0A815NDJ2_ADIRI|nr:unnamed protein product [Adineta ricciae]CAF1431693.1 unnamed protein product [Adineta ricciae]
MANDEYAYEIIDNEKDARLCAQLIAEEFTSRHPITLFDRLTTRSFFDDHSWPLLTDVFDEKLSFLARERLSGEIIGTIIAGDLYLNREKYPYDISHPPRTLALSDLYDELSDRFVRSEFNQELKPNTILHILIIAVRSDHTGNGVATRLHEVLCEQARNLKGFRYAFVRATNPVVQHIYVNKMNGRQLTSIDPATWRWKKQTDRLVYPYRNYNDEVISNILITLIADNETE